MFHWFFIPLFQLQPASSNRSSAKYPGSNPARLNPAPGTDRWRSDNYLELLSWQIKSEGDKQSKTTTTTEIPAELS
jgi:hypothetical protein